MVRGAFTRNGAPIPTVLAGDVELAYELEGAGEPVLLLHGLGGRGSAWLLQSAALSRAFRVVSLDLRGHGGSTVTRAPVSMATLAADVAAFCRALSLGPCHVIGHSLGGMVALQLALDSPESVRTLAVVNSTACGRGPWVRSFVLKSVIRVAGMSAFARLNTRLHLPEPGQESLRQRLVETMGACSADGYLSGQAAVDGFDVRARLKEIACPVLVVHSDQDAIPAKDKHLIASQVRHGRLVTVEHSRHLVVWDQPERLNEELLKFLAENGP